MSKFSHAIPLEPLVARQMRHWERTYNKGSKTSPKPIAPCITISRELGSQGNELAHGLATKLNWQLYDRELVDLIANNAQVRKSMVESFDEKIQSELHNWLLTLLDRHALGLDQYFKHLIPIILAIGERGEAVILGRGCNFVLPPTKALRLKVVAPLKKRIQFVREQKGVTRKEAEQLIAEADKERLAFIRRHFHHDSEDPLHYDLVINMGNFDLPTAEEFVTESLNTRFRNVKKIS